MAGFTLPRLRWLVIGAALAGGWAYMNGDVPGERPRAGLSKPERASVMTTRLPQSVTVPARRPVAGVPRREPSQVVTGAIPRPQAAVAPARPARRPEATTRTPAQDDRFIPKADIMPVRDAPSSVRRTRAAQEGNCQCPYDLMVGGRRECGEHSAYSRQEVDRRACFR